MMKPKNDKRASKFLSLILRHKPEIVGLSLDSQGYVPVTKLLTALAVHGWDSFSKEDLDRVVTTNNKKRFAYNEDESLIRASQGHSISVDLDLKPIEPPQFLYHGTVEKFMVAIKKEGLQKRSRQHVHLSADIATATNVGERRGSAIILTIAANEMFKQGYNFYKSANGVWLADEVPVKFISFD